MAWSSTASHTSRWARRALAVAALAAAGAALAFVRTQTGPGCASKIDVWWAARRITYQVNARGYHGPCADPGAAIRASFPSWTAATLPGAAEVCTDFTFVDGGDTARVDTGYDPANPVNLVVVRDDLCSAHDDPLCSGDPGDMDACVEKYNCWSHDRGPEANPNALAQVTVFFRPSTGEILDADMEINGWNGQVDASTGYFFTCADPGAGTTSCVPGSAGADCVAYDIQNTATHEAGHMLGLAHSPDAEATMAESAALGETEKRTLAEDDVRGVCAIYPKGGPTAIPAPTTCASAAPPPQGGCSSGAAGLAALIGPALAWRRRRERAGRPFQIEKLPWR